MVCTDVIAILVQLLFLIHAKIMFAYLSTPRVYPKSNFYVKMYTCENQCGNFNSLFPATELLKILSGISCTGWSCDGWSSLSVWQDLESPRRQLPEGVWGCFQRGLTEKGRPVCSVGRTIPLTGIPNWMKREKWVESLIASLSASWPNATWPATSHSCHHVFPPRRTGPPNRQPQYALFPEFNHSDQKGRRRKKAQY